jgi:hypothetical protein
MRVLPTLATVALAAPAAKDDPKGGKMAAVNKVIKLFEDLQNQVLEEGEKEAASYNKFACFCKDTTSDKNEAISSGQNEKESLESKIESMTQRREELDRDIEDLQEDIADAESDMKQKKAERKKENKAYIAEEQDLSGAVSAVEGAIQAIMASKRPSLVQLQSVAQTVRSVSVLADALGMGGRVNKALSALGQDPGVPMENYKFHSGGVLETLEGLRDDFRQMKKECDEEEVENARDYDMYMQEKTDYVKAKNYSLDKDRKERETTTKDLAAASDKYSTVSAQLLDDKQYLSELAQICTDKAKTWDQRTKCRADELQALTSALEIVKSEVADSTDKSTLRLAQQGTSVNMVYQMVRNPAAMEAIEAAAEEADAKRPANFLQKLIQKHKPLDEPVQDGRQAVIAALTKDGKHLKSTLLVKLAGQISSDPLAKVKTLIGELIERLLNESAKEADQKAWCDKAQGEAKAKRRRAAEKIDELNGRMAENEAIRDKLTEEMEELENEIDELEENKDTANKMRKQEKLENEETVLQAKTGLEAVQEAIDIMKKFYKTAAKEEVDLSLAQTGRGPADDMPDSGFKAGEAYQGAQGESTGVIGMLEVIEGDFQRTIKETEKAEKQADDDHKAFLAETDKSLAEKNTAHEEKEKQKDAAVDELADDSETLDSQSDILDTVIRELLELKPTCVDTGMSYEERVARREDEIESLKKALCIFQNYNSGDMGSC